jgi:hypothetical protein
VLGLPEEAEHSIELGRIGKELAKNKAAAKGAAVRQDDVS